MVNMRFLTLAFAAGITTTVAVPQSRAASSTTSKLSSTSTSSTTLQSSAISSTTSKTSSSTSSTSPSLSSTTSKTSSSSTPSSTSASASSTTSKTSASSTQPTSAARAYCSNSDLSYALSSIPGPTRNGSSPSGASTWQLTIDDSSAGYKQTINGFGAAVTDATVASFNTLSSGQLSQLLSQLLTTSGNGAGFGLMRHTIGASDLSADPPYTYDDRGTSPDSSSLPSFTLGGQGNAMAALIAQMQTVNPGMQVLGSPWSPPGWMKLNGVIQGNTTNNNLNDGYLTNNGPQYSQAFANYFVKYIQAYRQKGATIAAVTLQNEPLNSQAGYPTMYMFDYEQAQLIQNYVGPAISKAGLGTSIWAYDHNTDQPGYPQTVLNGAGAYVKTVAWHCYATSLDWTVLTNFHNSNPGVQQYMTECWTPASLPWSWSAGFVMGPLQNWASGAMAWTLGTNAQDGPHLSTGGCATCQGLVTVTNGGYVLNTAYYMMAQFSKFMPRGATVLSGSGSYSYSSGAGIQSVATLNPDGTRTVVIMNTFGNDVFTTVTGKKDAWSGNVPANSLTTWILPKV